MIRGMPRRAAVGSLALCHPFGRARGGAPRFVALEVLALELGLGFGRGAGHAALEHDEPRSAPVGQRIERGVVALGVSGPFAGLHAGGRRRFGSGAELLSGRGGGRRQRGERKREGDAHRLGQLTLPSVLPSASLTPA